MENSLGCHIIRSAMVALPSAWRYPALAGHDSQSSSSDWPPSGGWPAHSTMMIRIAQPDELPSILAIYNQAVAARRTGDLSPLGVEDRRAWFAEHDPDHYPILVCAEAGTVRGWCSLSPYRKGRMAFRYTAEVSYYVAEDSHRRGIGSALLLHAIETARSLGMRSLVAILLETNLASRKLLERAGFVQWGFLPDVADIDGEECGHYYYGLRVGSPEES